MLALMRARAVRPVGFTLIELMVTLAIAAILMMVAVPSFTAFQRNAELTATANTFLAAINSARSEAMKRNLPAVVLPLGTGWASGWTVFVDMDRDNTLSSGDITLAVQPALKSYFTIVANSGSATGSTPYIRFDGSGYPKTTTTGASYAVSSAGVNMSIMRNDVSGNTQVQNTRYLVVAITGRGRVCTPASASDTNCNSSSTN